MMIGGQVTSPEEARELAYAVKVSVVGRRAQILASSIK